MGQRSHYIFKQYFRYLLWSRSVDGVASRQIRRLSIDPGSSKARCRILLGLEVADIARRRSEVQERRQRIQHSWTRLVQGVQHIASGLNGFLRGLETALSSQVKQPMMDLLIHKRGKYWNISNWIKQLSNDLAAIELELEPDAQRRTGLLSDEINSLEHQLASLRVEARVVYDRVVGEEAEAVAISERLKTLRRDRQRNKDVQRLVEYGSVVTSTVLEHHCPTCGQAIADTVIPQIVDSNVLSIDAQLEFIDSQIDAFKAVLPSTSESAERARRVLNDLRATIGAFERSLAERRAVITGKSSPALAVLRRKVELEVEADRAVASSR